MRRVALGLGLIIATAAAPAAACPGGALGTSRQIAVDAHAYPRVGVMQYRQSLPLADHEVVLTFDDGPLPPSTERVLSALAAECVKATFFITGRQAKAHPDLVRRIYDAGHTVGMHSQNHPLLFNRISEARAAQEIEQGLASLKSVLGPNRTLAPFFRVPGLGRTASVEAYLQRRSIVVWSADTEASDWRKNTPDRVMQLALSRLEARGRGILLLHDIQPRTAAMLPSLLKELKRRGFRIVHAVPGGSASPAVSSRPQVPGTKG